MTPNIEDQIRETNVPAIQQMFSYSGKTPHPFQCAVYEATAKVLRSKPVPAVNVVSVSGGKTLLIAMIAARLQELHMPTLVLSRQAEIIEQNAAELWDFKVKNSIYCAGLGRKSAVYPTVCASEGTLVNALHKDLSDFAPLVLLVDECHMVDDRDIVDYEQKLADFNAGNSEERPDLSQRKLYTQIIVELQRRCMEKHKKTLRIIGYTGTPFRGVDPIINEDMRTPGFWRFQACNVDTNYLVKLGFVVPTLFGDTEGLTYDLDEFHSDGQDGIKDFTAEELKKMEKAIRQQRTLTHDIMAQVHRIASTRNGVLVTCSGVDHCKEAAEALPPGTTYAIITEKTSVKQRRDILKKAFTGKIKYVFQVMALTTGVNQPLWDTSVLLRRIGSLTLLKQLLGRGMRLLKPEHVAAGYVKNDHLVLDYSGTMDDLGQLYYDPILEAYQYRPSRDVDEKKKCEMCGYENSFYARRCVNEIPLPWVVRADPLQGFPFRSVRCRAHVATRRCERFWQYKECGYNKHGEKIFEGCGTKNDPTARNCRHCGLALIDPNEKLSGKHYTENDWITVDRMVIKPTKNNGLVYQYHLRRDDGFTFMASEFFAIASENKIARKIWLANGLMKHTFTPQSARELWGIKNAEAFMGHAHKIRQPLRVTHRKNGEGKDIIHRKDFGSDL